MARDIKKAVGRMLTKKSNVGKPIYRTKDGENVSEKTVSFKYKGQIIVIPSIQDGQKRTQPELKRMLDAGTIKPIKSGFKSYEEAGKYADKRSRSLMRR